MPLACFDCLTSKTYPNLGQQKSPEDSTRPRYAENARRIRNDYGLSPGPHALPRLRADIVDDRTGRQFLHLRFPHHGTLGCSTLGCAEHCSGMECERISCFPGLSWQLLDRYYSGFSNSLTAARRPDDLLGRLLELLSCQSHKLGIGIRRGSAETSSASRLPACYSCRRCVPAHRRCNQDSTWGISLSRSQPPRIQTRIGQSLYPRVGVRVRA